MSPSRRRLKKYMPFMYMFFISLVVGLIFWDSVQLPFSNPWGVTGNLTVIEYNPANDFVRYGLFILLPLIPMIIMYVLNLRKSNDFYFQRRNIKPLENPAMPLWQKILFPSLFLLYTLIYTIGLPTYHAHGPLDTFHEGESLGFAISYMEGLIPYKDYLFVHGTFQDPLRSVLAFQLFGQSIGAVRTLESIISIISFLLLTLFILKIYQHRPLPAFITMSIIFALLVKGFVDINRVLFIPITLPPRDITTLSFLLTIPVVQKYLQVGEQDINRRRFCLTVFLFSFIPFATFAYSIDRAFYMTAAYLLLSIPVYLSVRKVGGGLDKSYLLAALAGVVGGIVVFGIIIRGAFAAFIDFAFLTMPKYKELMDGFIFPVYNLNFLFVVMLIALNVFWVMYKILQEIHYSERKIGAAIVQFMRKYMLEMTLLLLSVFFFRSALGRSDWEHISYSILPLYLLSLNILLKYYMYPFLNYLTLQKAVSLILIGIMSLSLIWQGGLNLNRRSLEAKFPLQVSDAQLIPDNYKSAIHFLRQNLRDDEYFFTMTSEAIWYYFVEKPCPARFPVVWFAMPYFYQEEIIEDLQSNNVKYILYRNDHWANAIDGFPNEEKLPILVQHIHDNYQYYYSFYDNEIWIRK